MHYVEWFVLHWKICTTLNDLYCVEWFVPRWIICTMLNDLHCVEWYVIRLMICTTFNDLNYVAWFVQRWIICTALNYLQYSVELIVLRWMIRSEMDDLYNVESFGLRLIIEYRLFNECQVCLFVKILIFYTNLWVDFFLIWKYQEEIFSALPQILFIKRCFWSL